MLEGRATREDVRAAGDPIFSRQVAKNRMSVLHACRDGDRIATLRDELVAALADEGVFVLRRGALERYIGQKGHDKLSNAFAYIADVRTRDDVLRREGGAELAATVERAFRAAAARLDA
jgi:hypothetical protein